MMAEAAHRLGIKVACLDAGGMSSPCGQLCSFAIEGGLLDEEKIQELGRISDVMTVEIEHVNCDALEALEKGGTPVHPNPATVRLIQDKYLQKKHFQAHGVPMGDFIEVSSADVVDDCRRAGEALGYPFMLKNRRFAYDGKGNAAVSSAAEVIPALLQLAKGSSNSTSSSTTTANDGDESSFNGMEVYAEKWVPFSKELAVMVVRTNNKGARTVNYPVVETVQKDSICHLVACPANIPKHTAAAAEAVVTQAIGSLSGLGIYGVELFLAVDPATGEETVLLNEVAPRPHNSGHYTLEACDIDQFEMHLRAVLGLPTPQPRLLTNFTMMVNVLGEGSDMEQTKAPLQRALSVPGAGIHWYGKASSRKGRKMAHVTVTGTSAEQVREKVTQIIVAGERERETGIADTLMSIDSLLGLESSSNSGGKANKPRVSIIMGSDSDLTCMKEAAKVLESFSVPYELTIVSAHRTPTRMYSYAQAAAGRGIEVIIAGAGGAAHLPGMVAALTPLPVVGVPVLSSAMSGEDSLLSIVQMPRGVPVATVAIGNAANAGLLAVRILGAQDYSLLSAMKSFLDAQEEEVLVKAARLEAVGYDAYKPKNENINS
jgi:phosphoribosylaminoimidazole carboxylase